MANYYQKDSSFLALQTTFNQQLREKFSNFKIESDKLDEPILWCEKSIDVLAVIKTLMTDFGFDFLSDITAYDNSDEIDGKKRFILAYQIASLPGKLRIRIKCAVDLEEHAESIVSIWPAANWLEREVYDMFGIIFDNHPNLERILMDIRFTGYPLRKEYPIKLREPFADNTKIDLPLASTQPNGEN